MTQSTNWTERFFELSQNISKWSKDPSKKIGAVAIDPITKRILSTGYNGFPRGIDDSPERLNERQVKYTYVVHAEMNVIYNACANGVSLANSHLYVTGLPICSECAKGIIQVGISKVFIKVFENVPDTWKESWKNTTAMFAEAGLQWEFYEDTNSGNESF
jgi:dCMP deaminase